MLRTKEPWPEAVSMERECGDSYSHFWRIKDVGDFESQDDAERARACVNACAGIDDVVNVQEAFDLLEEFLKMGTSPDWIRRAVEVVNNRE